MTGFICVNKQAGKSSAAEVAAIKKLTGMPCGHMGTLDPMASGVLPVAIGNAARLFDYFLKKRKTYVATFRFGVDYDTLDTTGTLISSGGRVPTEEEILNIIPTLTGEVMQIPPKYSAKNVNGKRGYELARAGVEFTLEAKKVNIYAIELLKKVDEASYSFEIECGGGTYIRSIARDMAKCLKTVAAMSGLVRTSSGVFTIEKSVKTQELTKDNIQSFIIPCESVLPYTDIRLCGDSEKKVLNGVAVKCGYEDGIYKIYKENGAFYGLASVDCGMLKVRTKLC